MKAVAMLFALLIVVTVAGCTMQYAEVPSHKVDRLTVAGTHQEAAGNLEAALSTYNEALEVAPRSAELWLRQGRVQLALDRVPEARTSLNNALVFDPDNTDAMFFLGVIDVKDNNLGAAEVMAKAIRDNTPQGVIPSKAIELEDLIKAQHQRQTILRRNVLQARRKAYLEGKAD